MQKHPIGVLIDGEPDEENHRTRQKSRIGEPRLPISPLACETEEPAAIEIRVDRRERGPERHNQDRHPLRAALETKRKNKSPMEVMKLPQEEKYEPSRIERAAAHIPASEKHE